MLYNVKACFEYSPLLLSLMLFRGDSKASISEVWLTRI